jgi:serine protease Do
MKNKYFLSSLMVFAAIGGVSLGAQEIHMFQAGGGYLGISIRDIDSEDVADLRLPTERGVYIENVADESPAREAGLSEGDVVVEFSGQEVMSVRQFQRLVNETPPGRSVDVRVWRNGTDQMLRVEVGKRSGMAIGPMVREKGFLGSEPGVYLHRAPGDFDFHWSPDAGPLLGVKVIPLTSQLAETLNVPGSEGVFVTDVIKDTPAAKAGLRAGDVIVSVNDRGIDDVGELKKALTEGEQELEIVREKSTLKVTVELPNKEQREKKSETSERM